MPVRHDLCRPDSTGYICDHVTIGPLMEQLVHVNKIRVEINAITYL